MTIEHMPAQGTYDVGAAPREFDVWGFVEGDGVGRVEAELSKDCRGERPAEGYVCLGGGAYDVHAGNHVQNFALFGGVEVGLVRKVVLRVRSNWGQDWTCLYRVRVFGRRVKEEGGELDGESRVLRDAWGRDV